MVNSARRHLVERQRAGLVGADRRDRAQRLHRRQPLDDGALVGQRPRAHGVHGGHDRRQAGRDGRNRQGNAGDEDGVEGLAVAQTQDDHQDERQAGQAGDDDGQPVELLLQGVLSDSVLLSRSAMWPISVPMPVVVTIISPRPRVTEVFM